MGSPEEVDTETVVARARAGDQEAWAALTDRFNNVLWAVARGMRLSHADAGDAVQTTWLRLVENLDRVHQPEHLKSWLVTTLRRECLAVLRRGSREQPTMQRWDDEADPGDAPGELLLRAERDAELWRAFARLRPYCQSLLRVLTGNPPLSYAEVSEVLGMPVGSIGPMRRRCLDTLRQFLA
jgi:RNA polymerase sigma factor (sigma-70 family)